MTRWRVTLATLFLASLAINWPELPGNLRLAELLFVPLAALTLMQAPRLAPWTPLDAAVAVYLAGALPSLLVSGDSAASGLEFARHLYLAAAYLAIATVARLHGAESVVRGLALMGALLAWTGALFAGLYLVTPFASDAGEVMKLPYVGAVLRLKAFTASPTMLACVLTAALPCAVYQARVTAGGVRRAWAVTAIAIVAAAVMTFSHAIAGVVVAGTIALWPELSTRTGLRRAAVAATVVVILFFNASVTASVRSLSIGDRVAADRTRYPYAVDEGRLRVGEVAVDYEVMSYLRLKTIAWEAFARRPIAGVGLDRFHDVSEAAYGAGRLPGGYRAIDPHSTLLGRLAETGAIGGITLLALWWASGRRLQRATADASTRLLAFSLVAGLAGLLINSINVDVMNFRFVWAALGLLRGLTLEEAA